LEAFDELILAHIIVHAHSMERSTHVPEEINENFLWDFGKKANWNLAKNLSI
jgi:hypothetical protein